MSEPGAPRPDPTAELFAACAAGDLAAVTALLERIPSLAGSRNPEGATPLHAAVRHPAVLRALLARGADPNARDVGDHALPLHFAAAGPLESVRILLDAGSDVHGVGDVHRLEVIGWATVFGVTDRAIIELLVSRGARHHVFSAVALGDRDLLRDVVAADQTAMARRLSPFEQEQSPLHYVIAPPDGLGGGRFRTGDHYRTLDLLVELGADLEARDAKGRTPLDLALLLGDLESGRRLVAAGAVRPAAPEPGPAPPLGGSMKKLRPMVGVQDVGATIEWYRAIGFELLDSHDGGNGIDWASVAFGGAEVMLVPAPAPPAHLSLWIETDRLDDLYGYLKRRQIARALARIDGRPVEGPDVAFSVDLHTAFYGQREFGLRDPNGIELVFAQPVE